MYYVCLPDVNGIRLGFTNTETGMLVEGWCGADVASLGRSDPAKLEHYVRHKDVHQWGNVAIYCARAIIRDCVRLGKIVMTRREIGIPCIGGDVRFEKFVAVPEKAEMFARIAGKKPSASSW